MPFHQVTGRLPNLFRRDAQLTNMNSAVHLDGVCTKSLQLLHQHRAYGTMRIWMVSPKPPNVHHTRLHMSAVTIFTQVLEMSHIFSRTLYGEPRL
ncbi:hypothetical protein DB347_24455 [Opitutaceae bacterium EW11]|nr:hypothetical protein DB347_24455 [Opitutaceae bacterium EW11]